MRNGRLCLRAHFYKVQITLFRQPQRVKGLQDPQLLPVLVDDLEFRDADLMIDA